MTAVEDASVAAETADVVDLVFSYLFIFLIIKWGGAKAEGRGGEGGGGVCELIFIGIGDPKKMILRVKNQQQKINPLLQLGTAEYLQSKLWNMVKVLCLGRDY